jgi:carbonic anhydrase
MKKLIAVLAALVLAAPLAATASDAAHAAPAGPSPDKVLAELLAGNQRFAKGKPAAKPLDAKKRAELAKGQHPKAVVLTCSDSRVPPELLFDQGVGDIFTIRLAGNVAVPSAVGSAEYAVEHLGSKLIVVLGHTKCGAVKATAEAKDAAAAGPNLGTIVEEISPAVVRARAYQGAEPAHHDAEHENVREAAEHLATRSPAITELVKEGKVKIVTGLYDLQTGQVHIDQ